MQMATFAIAAALVAIAGFATQRGTICAVQAGRDVVERRSWARFVSFLECAAWSALILIAATLMGSSALAHALAYELGLIPIIGGSVFGLGALVNGACAFGSVARLAGGDLSYLAIPPAFLLGAFLAVDRWPPEPLLADQTEVSIIAILIALTPFALWRFVTAIKTARDRGAMRSVRQPVWRPAFAVFVIASVNAGALLLLGPWPFTSQLPEVKRDGMGDLVRLAVTLAFVLGAIAGGVTAKRFRLLYPDLKGLGRRLAGGTFMGIGAALIPGGNDRLVLVDLPLLHVHAVLAYGAMAAAIILGLALHLWTAKTAGRIRNHKQRAVDR